MTKQSSTNAHSEQKPKKRQLPSFTTLRKNYNTISDREVFLKSIFDAVKDEAANRLENTCALRVSDALNRSGFIVPQTPENRSYVSWYSNKTGKRYVSGTLHFVTFLTESVGPPTIRQVGEKVNKTAFLGKKGIIYWHAGGLGIVEDILGEKYSGHTTLWDGKSGVYVGQDWFSLPNKRPTLEFRTWVDYVLFWEAPP